MEKELLSHWDLFVIVCGMVMGTAARAVTLRIDSRQYPSYPNGMFINLVTGFVAAALGAVAIPTLLAGNFTAVTFLTLAVQHFREIRKTERDSLDELDSTEYAVRSAAYIDGISKTYEARNYIALLAALFTVLAMQPVRAGAYFAGGLVGAGAGSLSIWLLYRFTKGQHVSDIADVREGRLEVRDSSLFVDGIFVTNTMGREETRDFLLTEGVGVVVTPNGPQDRLTLENFGQRQAMVFEAIRSFGVKRYRFSRRSFEDGRIAIAFVPILRDPAGIIKAVRGTPILESTRKKSSPTTSEEA